MFGLVCFFAVAVAVVNNWVYMHKNMDSGTGLHRTDVVFIKYSPISIANGFLSIPNDYPTEDMVI